MCCADKTPELRSAGWQANASESLDIDERVRRVDALFDVQDAGTLVFGSLEETFREQILFSRNQSNGDLVQHSSTGVTHTNVRRRLFHSR